MNRPENGIVISPRVDKLENGELEVVVRRLTFIGGRVVIKEALTPDGKWVDVIEGQRYPEECFLPAGCVFDRAEEIRKAKEWEEQSKYEGWVKVAEEAKTRITHGNI